MIKRVFLAVCSLVVTVHFIGCDGGGITGTSSGADPAAAAPEVKKAKEDVTKRNPHSEAY
jgi:hypothetical protein